MASTFSKIMVAVDGTPAAGIALAEAIALTRDEGAALVIAHVTHSLGEESIAIHEPDLLPEPAHIACLNAAHRAASLAGVQATTELLVGHPPTQLAAAADDLDVDLIVIGSRQLNGLKRALLGSTSRALLKQTSRPV